LIAAVRINTQMFIPHSEPNERDTAGMYITSCPDLKKKWKFWKELFLSEENLLIQI
jgi:hypothetical protein